MKSESVLQEASGLVGEAALMNEKKFHMHIKKHHEDFEGLIRHHQ